MTDIRSLKYSVTVMLVLLLAFLSACSDTGDSGFKVKRALGDQEAPEITETEAGEEPPPAPPPEPFIIYYTIDPVPDKLLKGWMAEIQADWPVEQRNLPGDLSQLPVDGDFYVVTPQWIPMLQAAVELESFESTPLLGAVNPTFTGFSFDPGNRFCLPWRWTPYGHVIKTSEAGYQPGSWLEKENYVWPEDPILRAAVWRRSQGFSANSFQRAAPAPENPQAYLSWDECRQRWQEENYHVMYLPAAWWLQRPKPTVSGEPPVPEKSRLLLSTSGELLHFEHLVVASGRERVTMARALAAYLLTGKAQQWLLPYTGYFPVVSAMSEEMKGADLPVESSDWLDLCEFTLAPPAYREPPRSSVPEDAEDEDPSPDEDVKKSHPEKPMMAPLDQMPPEPPVG